MKKLILIGIVIMLSTNSFARKKNAVDIKSPKKGYMNYMNQYGVDDTSKAIINLYYDKRALSLEKMSFTPIIASVALVVPPIGLGMTVIYSPLLINGSLTRLRYSKNRMEKTLNNYNKNNTLTTSMRDRIKKYIRKENMLFNMLLSER